MDDFKYNFLLLREARIRQNMTIDNVAFDLCLAPRQIHSIENNLPDFFYSPAIKLTCIKKYAEKLGLDINDVLDIKVSHSDQKVAPIKKEDAISLDEEAFVSEPHVIKTAYKIRKASRKLQPKKQQTKHAVIERVTTYIQNNLANKITMADLRNASNYSERSIQLIFQRHFNQTPFEYIEEQRLLKAKELIEKHKRSKKISSIAQDVGFFHLGRFSVNFRQRFGISPSLLAED